MDTETTLSGIGSDLFYLIDCSDCASTFQLLKILTKNLDVILDCTMAEIEKSVSFQTSLLKLNLFLDVSLAFSAPPKAECPESCRFFACSNTRRRSWRAPEDGRLLCQVPLGQALATNLGILLRILQMKTPIPEHQRHRLIAGFSSDVLHRSLDAFLSRACLSPQLHVFRHFRVGQTMKAKRNLIVHLH